jgi:hypothetical protein
MHIKGYYIRAKVFGYLVAALGVCILLYYFFQDYLN